MVRDDLTNHMEPTKQTSHINPLPTKPGIHCIIYMRCLRYEHWVLFIETDNLTKYKKQIC